MPILLFDTCQSLVSAPFFSMQILPNSDTVWALFYTLSSLALGWVLKRLFKFPPWTVLAICFNNTTALPLLLIQSLATSGILDGIMKEGDTTSAAVNRAKSYFLVSSMVGNSLTFAIGPNLLDDEETPDEHRDRQKLVEVKCLEYSNERVESDEEHGHLVNSCGRTEEQQEEHVNETITLLPNRIAAHIDSLDEVGFQKPKEQWIKLPPAVRKCLIFVGSFVNAPLIGAIIGVIIGLTPPLHKAFLNEPTKGGIFNA